jgi:hypothetical protein
VQRSGFPSSSECKSVARKAEAWVMPCRVSARGRGGWGGCGVAPARPPSQWAALWEAPGLNAIGFALPRACGPSPAVLLPLPVHPPEPTSLLHGLMRVVVPCAGRPGAGYRRTHLAVVRGHGVG